MHRHVFASWAGRPVHQLPVIAGLRSCEYRTGATGPQAAPGRPTRIWLRQRRLRRNPILSQGRRNWAVRSNLCQRSGLSPCVSRAIEPRNSVSTRRITDTEALVRSYIAPIDATPRCHGSTVLHLVEVCGTSYSNATHISILPRQALAAALLLMATACADAQTSGSPGKGDQITGSGTVVDGSSLDIKSNRIRVWGIDTQSAAPGATATAGAGNRQTTPP